MPSFDIVSKVDPQTLDNTVNTVKKEITNRFDFKDSHVQIELDKKDLKILIEVESEMKLKQVTDSLISRSVKQGLDPLAFNLSGTPFQSGKYMKLEVPVRSGLDQQDAKKIVKLIRDSGLKAQAQIMEDIVRVTSKKIDDLQAVIHQCKTANLGIPLQFINMKS
ncbi:MAG TPA: YajQ family cyclic di-GMP-binding protein [Chitinophagaceae bacterium]|nr:YajQ family cyclic di-GMP-binding protein [Chitinophagaceae bacterium]